MLLLLPSSTSKLLAKWQGPYTILKKITYKIHHPDKGKESQVYHVNLIKEWHEKMPEGKRALIACKVAPEDEGDDNQVDDEAVKHSQSVVSLDHLESYQREKLEEVLAEYPDLFRLEPGRTKVLEHIIHLTDTNPIRHRPYSVPESLVTPLKKEIQLMRDLGVIESSTSVWSSPIVLVPKKDGSLRLCLDFRRHNSISKFDAYPMPRNDELVERIGRVLAGSAGEEVQRIHSVQDTYRTLSVHNNAVWITQGSGDVSTVYGPYSSRV